MEKSIAKYTPLHERLRGLASPAEMTFDEIDRLVGGLPPSARIHRAWWGNDASHAHARAWLEAGRRVDSVDLEGGRVRFSLFVT